MNNHKAQGKWKIHSGNTITEHKTQGEWKIHLTMAINLVSSTDSNDFDENQIIYLKSDNIEIMMGSEKDEITEERFESFLQRYQERLEDSKKGSNLVFDSVDTMYYIFIKQI